MSRSTGLCRDCWLSERWTCTICDSTMSMQVMGPHLKHSHNVTIKELTP